MMHLSEGLVDTISRLPEWRQQREKGHPGVFIVNFEQVVGWL